MDRQLEEIFTNEGLLSQYLKSYEERKEQLEMARQIAEAYIKNQIALIEAGTGIGKSLAYLAPAIIWAMQKKERTVIATHTIALQEQLIEKEIPFLLKVLGVDLKPVLVKGMGNYLCLRKYAEMKDGHPQLENWVIRTQEGSRSDIDFPLSTQLWDKVAAEPERCTGAKCPHYKPCFFFKARRHIRDAKLAIVNHHLLLADLTAEKEQAILPDFEKLILDEAHNLEEIALESLSQRVDMAQLVRILSQKLVIPNGISLNLQTRLEIDFPSQCTLLLLKVEEAFGKLPLELCTRQFFASEGERVKAESIRPKKAIAEDPIAKEEGRSGKNAVALRGEKLSCTKPSEITSSFRVKESLSQDITNGFIELKKEMSRFVASLEGLIKELETHSKLDYIYS